MSDPFLLSRPAVISFSGGRTSAYMLWRVIAAFDGDLPGDVVPIFANTGKERPETLHFVERVSQQWGVRIVWIEYRKDARFKFVEVDYATASRDGRPFSELICTKQMLPNVKFRYCTQWLKIKPSNRYARHVLGFIPKSGGYVNAVGFRFDEPHRVARMRPDPKSSPGEKPTAPLFDARVAHADVMDFWRKQPFDLELKGYQGNCDLCFLKGQGKIMQIMQEDPELAQWWVEKERAFKGKTRLFEAGRFRKAAPSYAATLKMVQEQQLLDFSESSDDESGIGCHASCRCTD